LLPSLLTTKWLMILLLEDSRMLARRLKSGVFLEIGDAFLRNNR